MVLFPRESVSVAKYYGRTRAVYAFRSCQNRPQSVWKFTNTLASWLTLSPSLFNTRMLLLFRHNNNNERTFLEKRVFNLFLYCSLFGRSFRCAALALGKSLTNSHSRAPLSVLFASHHNFPTTVVVVVGCTTHTEGNFSTADTSSACSSSSFFVFRHSQTDQ